MCTERGNLGGGASHVQNVHLDGLQVTSDAAVHQNAAGNLGHVEIDHRVTAIGSLDIEIERYRLVSNVIRYRVLGEAGARRSIVAGGLQIVQLQRTSRLLDVDLVDIRPQRRNLDRRAVGGQVHQIDVGDRAKKRAGRDTVVDVHRTRCTGDLVTRVPGQVVAQNCLIGADRDVVDAGREFNSSRRAFELFGDDGIGIGLASYERVRGYPERPVTVHDGCRASKIVGDIPIQAPQQSLIGVVITDFLLVIDDELVITLRAADDVKNELARRLAVQKLLRPERQTGRIGVTLEQVLINRGNELGDADIEVGGGKPRIGRGCLRLDREAVRDLGQGHACLKPANPVIQTLRIGSPVEIPNVKLSNQQ